MEATATDRGEGRGADAIASALRAEGVDVVFGLPGVHNLELWRACADHGVRIVGSRHEQGCAYAADGYARTTGAVGVALVTTGPGAANTLGAVGEAWAAHSPIVVIATDIPSGARRPGVYGGTLHECTDQAALFSPVTKAATLVEDPDDLSAALTRAMRTATADPAGPVYLGVPSDFLTAGVSLDRAPAPEMSPSPAAGPPAWAVELDGYLGAAERPVIWVGSGARAAGPQLGRLAERLRAPIVETVHGRGIVPAGHPWLVGMPPHEPAVTELIESSDLLLAVGTDFDAMSTQNWALRPPRPRVALNLDAADAGKNYEMDFVVEGDAATLLEQWLDELGESDDRAGITEVDEVTGLREDVRTALMEDDDTRPVLALVEMIDRRLPSESLVFTDMAIIGYWLSQYLPARSATTINHPAWGTLGFAFPASIGAAVSGRGPTFAFCGDGGILFAIGELAVLVQEDLDLTVVVFDDGGYGVLRLAHPDGDERFGTNLYVPDFVRIAAGFGIAAQAVEGIGEALELALTEAVESPGPRLLHVKSEVFPPRTTSARWPLRERAVSSAAGREA